MPATPVYYHGDTVPPLAIVEQGATGPVTTGTPTVHVVRPTRPGQTPLAPIDRALSLSGSTWMLVWQAGDLTNLGDRWVEYAGYLQPDPGEHAPDPIRIIVRPAP